MFVRVCTVRKGSTTYRYCQLVESYRRESDGQPCHRVVTNLGQLPDPVVENLRRAFRAGARGEVLVFPEDVRVPGEVLASLSWLDVGVCLAHWKKWQLDAILAELLPDGASDVPPASVIAALVMHRCIAPGSKLSAQQWFPRTALPELLEVSPGQFNNARVHRALDALDAAGTTLQERLALRLVEEKKGLSALFLDVSDTWFVGRGPDKAEERETKEGLWRRKVGIVLLCDEDGFPVRWAVIPGRRSDCHAMTDMAGQLQGVDWVRDVPVVCDRAMGHPRVVRRLARRGIRFVTMLNSNAFEAFAGTEVPYALTEGLGIDGPDPVAEADRAAERAGMARARDRLRVLDLGVREARVERMPKARVSLDNASQLARARAVRARLDAGESFRRIAASLGVSKGTLQRILPLLGLSDAVQATIDAGQTDALAIAELLRLAAMPVEVQHARLVEALAARPRPTEEEEEREDDDEAPRARVIVEFNPTAFVKQRKAAAATLGKLDREIAALNGALASPFSQRTETKAREAAARILRSFSLEEAFEIRVERRERLGRSYLYVELARVESAWAELRRRDGFSILVAHPDLTDTPDALVHLYASKGRIEEDFHVIKSVVDVRPVFHRKDAKVEAHVTLCMLALFVHRSIERSLQREATAAATLETLAPVHLVRSRCKDGPPIHQLVRASDAQRALVRTLGCDHLLDTRSIPTAPIYARD